VVVGVDPVLRDALVTGLLLDQPGSVALRYDVDSTRGELRRLSGDAFTVVDDSAVDLEHDCVSCAMREDAAPILEHIARSGRRRGVILAPPISADPEVVVRTLAPSAEGWHFSSVLAVADADRARHDVLGEDTLEERGLRWADGDERSVGEALCAQVEYADLRALSGDVPAGIELMEHLRAPDQAMAPSVHRIDPELVFGGIHDREAAEARRDPRRVESYGGPTVCGTFTLDLRARRPFHPERLLENIEDLGAGRLRSRGRFAVADRPGAVCEWDGAGGQVSIGVLGPTQSESARTGSAMPDRGRGGVDDGVVTNRLVVIGVDAEDMNRVRAAFGRSLVTHEEQAAGLAPWLGTHDVLAPWLGGRAAALELRGD
jgi:G3E family GTPase